MSIVECRAWSVACCVSRVACRILLSLLATHALATGLASGANVGCADFTLDGKGALLVFWRKHPKDWDANDGGPVGEGVNLFLNRCRRVRVENLTMDWDWSIAPLGFLGVCVDKHIVFRDNRVEFDGHAPYELLPDAGKEKQSPGNIEDRKEAQP